MKYLRYLLILLMLSAAFFAVSCESECKHNNVNKTVIEPSCTESGRDVYTCADCTHSYTINVIDPIGHTYTENVVSATCNEVGYTEYTCACGYSYKTNITSPLGHDKNGGSFGMAPTCDKEGYTHYACSRCGFEYDANQTAPLGHTFKKEVHESTCEEAGYTVFKCACGYSYISDHTDPSGHSFEAVNVSPTCLENGYTEYSCVNCSFSYKSDWTVPGGHSYSENTVIEASCETEGSVTYTCACGDSYSTVVAPTGHSFSKRVTMPTLSDMGSTLFHCTTCGHEYTGELTFFSDVLDNAYANNSEVLAKGIDVSYHNYKMDSDGNYISLDWEAIKASGIDYVIIRAGDAAIGIDPTFEQSYNDARAAGLDIGVYFYTRATTVNEIALEANLVLSVLEGKQFEYPIYLDLEDDSLSTIPASDLTEMCVQFFTTLQRAGYYTGLYVNEEWLKNHVQTDVALRKFEIWYARYPAAIDGQEPVWSIEEYGEHLGMWQYSDSSVIEGIDGTEFDLNYAYKDYPSLIEGLGFNGFDSNVVFVDTDKTFVWVIFENAIKIRSKNDYFVNDDYDSSLDVIGYADYGSRFEVVEVTEQYTAIIYEGQLAYISVNPIYVSFEGLYVK